MKKFFFEKKDILDNPYIVRQYALSREFDAYVPNEESVWSGFRCKISNEETEELLIKLQDHFEKRIKLNDVYFHTNPKISMHGFPYKHSDNENAFLGVIYLNELTDINAGTTLYEDSALYQHKDFLEKMQIVYATTVAENNTFKKIHSEECLNIKKNVLREVISFDFEFNKMVCYSANYLHSSNFYFGDSKRTNRLTIEFSGEFHAD